MSTQPKTFLSPQQYLEIERKAEYTHEYYDGAMTELAALSESHATIHLNVLTALYGQLRNGPCRCFGNGMRLHVPISGFYAYPDGLVVCGERIYQDLSFTDTLLNPTLVFEVISPATEARDRGVKLYEYRQIESVQQCLLICSDRIHADIFTRQAENRWLLASYERLEDSLELASIGCGLPMADVYENVDLTQ